MRQFRADLEGSWREFGLACGQAVQWPERIAPYIVVLDDFFVAFTSTMLKRFRDRLKRSEKLRPV